MSKTLKIIQICRRFGPVGGMERYVWELVRELSALGHHITVLCEVDLSPEPLNNITIACLGEVKPKPRWLAHLRFSERVTAWVKAHPDNQRIIHSHERTEVHQVTTFHGPPFAHVRELPFWKRCSWRVKKNLELEHRELCAPQVQKIIPNSMHIHQKLSYYYPSVVGKLVQAIVPGVTPCQARCFARVPENAGVIGFIGKEWKRKGLHQVAAIVKVLAKKRPQLRVLLAGVEAADVQDLFTGQVLDVQYLGRVEVDDFYHRLDVLLHPAVQEPYGMVITEALSAYVPVVVSDACGAACEVTPERGAVVALDAPIEAWVTAIETQLERSAPIQAYQRSWKDVALEHVQLYQTVKQEQI